MKKFSLIISVLALVMGLSQCAKRPNAPTFGGDSEITTKTITFTTNGGAKGCFDQNGGLLDYAWDKNDVLHVYLQTGESKFTAGEYLGKMEIVSIEDKYSAKFEGTFTAPFPKNGWIRFVHCGNGITVTDGGTEYVDFSTQDGDKGTVSSKVVAVCDQQITDECTFNFTGCELTVQFAVVKFSFEKFEGNEDVVLSNVAETKLKVNETGVVEYLNGVSSTLSGMDENKNAYYTVFMPKSETKYKFSCGTRFANKKAGIEAGKFYSKDGNAIVLDLMPEGTVSGEYSVSATKKVYFSQGNLQYIGSAATPYWRFAVNQWDVIGYSQANANQEQDRDLFGWGTSGHKPVNDSHFLYYRPWDTDRAEESLYATNYFGYGPSINKTPDGPGPTIQGDITNSYYDWGVENPISNGGNTPNIWRTMTKDEWVYLLGRKSNDGDYMSYPCRVKVNDGYVNGYLILSDDNESMAISKNTYASWDETPSFETMPEDAAFLPMAGYRKGTDVSEVGTECRYQSTTHAEPEGHTGGRYNYNASLHYDACNVNDNPRATGRSVRLVQNIN